MTEFEFKQEIRRAFMTALDAFERRNGMRGKPIADVHFWIQIRHAALYVVKAVDRRYRSKETPKTDAD